MTKATKSPGRPRRSGIPGNRRDYARRHFQLAQMDAQLQAVGSGTLQPRDESDLPFLREHYESRGWLVEEMGNRILVCEKTE